MTLSESWDWPSDPHGAQAPSEEPEQVTPIQTQPPSLEPDPGYADSWLQATAEAAAFAEEADTPEAWQSFTSAAQALVEIAQSLEVVAEAKRRAWRLEMTAQEALGEAADINEQAEELADHLQELTRKVEDAIRESDDARQRAEELAQAGQDATRRAEDAIRGSVEARESARQMEEFMSQAREINSVASWNEARRRVAAAWPLEI